MNTESLCGNKALNELQNIVLLLFPINNTVYVMHAFNIRSIYYAASPTNGAGSR